MMRFHIKVLTAVLSVSLLLTACSSTNQQATVTQTQQDQTGAAKTDGENQTGEKSQREGNFQRPDLVGKVKSIIGNEVVLELVELPTREQGTGSGTGSQQPAAGGAGGGSMPAGMRQAGTMQLKLTGETKTLLIPVGVPITSRSRSEETQLDIGDIYEGAILQIWFDEADKEMITKVSVMQSRG
ncbi:MAG: hypothetical protein ACOYVK_01155 [Bacillota bacterium]